jgi:hypothetical protein
LSPSFEIPLAFLIDKIQWEKPPNLIVCPSLRSSSCANRFVKEMLIVEPYSRKGSLRQKKLYFKEPGREQAEL